MINFLGKTLVIVHTLLCLLGMTWAGAMFLQFTDLGWKVPRQHLDQSIPSEFDKSVASIKLALQGRDLILPGVRPPQDSLRDTANYLPGNHLFYASELNRLRKSSDPIVVKGLKEGLDYLEPSKLPGLGKPKLDVDMPAFTKSYESYLADLQDQYKKIDAEQAAIRKTLEETREINFQLTGKDDAGESKTKGIYDLLDVETQTQSRLKAEREYMQPFREQAVEEARLYQLRRVGMELTLQKLQKK
jgi:hypothetical protein